MALLVQALNVPTTNEEVEAAKEQVTAGEARLQRQWGYVICGILAWRAFWDFADRHQRNLHAQLLAWLAVALAVFVAYYL